MSLLKRTRTAVDWLVPSHGGPGIVMNIDESIAQEAEGRFNPEGVDMNQSPVIWHPDYHPTPTWRGASEEDCVPNTWMAHYDPAIVEGTIRGEIIVRCPEKEPRGSRTAGSGKGKATTYMNNLLYGPTYIFGGVVGNPSRSRGNGGRTNRMGSAEGTAEYGGGSYTTAYNARFEAFGGQALYFSEIPYVVIDPKTKQVLGNHWRFRGYSRDKRNNQPKLLPTLIAMDYFTIEQLQAGPLFELSQALLDMLSPGRIVSKVDDVAKFTTGVLQMKEASYGFAKIPSITFWLRINVLCAGLERAFFSLKSDNPQHASQYKKAARALYAQLAAELQAFYKDEARKMNRRYGSKKHTLAQRYNDRFPMRLDKELALSGSSAINAESGMSQDFDQVFKIITRAKQTSVTLHNQLYTWLRNHWVGTITSPNAQPGSQIKYMRA